ncbi:MAG: IS3 family transposase, partial [Methylococcales bacterium]|nr:IS3 family transposase [Methylococcales bacterium]
PGSGYDNAAAEIVFGLLKRERVTHRKYTTRDEARADILMTLNNFIVNENNDS